MQRVAQKRFGDGLRRGAFEARAGSGFLEYVRVADDAAGGVDAHVEFFFLQRAEKARLPVPDVDVVRHHLVGLLEAYFALEVGLRRVVHIENDARIVAAELRALRGGKLLGLFEGIRARNFEIDGSFGEGLEEIFVRHARAEQAGENPDQKDFRVVPVEPLQRQARLR